MITVIITVIRVMTDQFVRSLRGYGLNHEHTEQEVDVGEGGHRAPGHGEGEVHPELHPGGLLLLLLLLLLRPEFHSLSRLQVALSCKEL